MYRSLSVLHPERLAAAASTTSGMHRAVARHHESARIERISWPGFLTAGHGTTPGLHAKLPHARGAARKSAGLRHIRHVAVVKLCGS
jgi:hypothetical protein